MGENQKRRQSGFTLIEIMVVVMIIGMLAAVVGVQLFNRLEKAKRKATLVQIRQLQSALANYRLDNNRFPNTEQGLQSLVERPNSEPVPKNYPQGGYLDAKKVPLDPWGSPYVYFAPGVNGEDYTIESYAVDGADGGEGNNADIESWHLEDESQ